MSQNLAFFPVRAQVNVAAAEKAAFLTITKESQEAQWALTISLLHGSWCVGQMTLAAALRHLRSALHETSWRTSFLDDSLWLSAFQGNEATATAREAVQMFADRLTVNRTDDEVQSIFIDACDALHEVLSLPPESGHVQHVLNCLLALPPEANALGLPPAELASLTDSARNGQAPSSLMSAFRSASANENAQGPRVFALPPDAFNRMAMLGALVHFGVGRLPAPAQEAPQPLTEAQTGATGDNPFMQVFDRKEVLEMLDRINSQPGGAGEENKKQLGLIQRMSNELGRRPLVQFSQPDALMELYERFPHFSPVLDFVRSSLALSACGEEGAPAYVPPILLRGAPGAGKTYFAQELARVLETPFIERDLSVTSAAFVLNGMDSTWKNSKPGVVFEALVSGKTANPLILLNEVDKAAKTGSTSSPIAPLHALLEPTSASRFVDEFVPVPLDASKVIWVLTANNEHIPEPILSRLEVFDIPEPTPAECQKIAQSVWASVCERALPKGHGFPDKLTQALLERMSRLSPRIMRKALTHAASQAVLDNRKYLQIQDLETAGKRYAPADRPTLGFVG